MLKFWATNILFAAGLFLFFFFKADLQLSAWYLLAWISLFLLIQFWGAYFIGLNFHLPSQNRLSTSEKTVALTFDDGPCNPHTERVLEVLKKHKVKAVFFVIGKNIAGNEPILKRIVDEGHQLGNHSFSHAFWFDLWHTKKVMQDVCECQELITKYQSDSKIFRPPYGVTNPNIARALKRLGLQSIGWSIRSYDTSVKDVEQINKRIMYRLKPGAIILLHDRLDFMPELLEKLIPEIKKKGFAFQLL